MTAKVIAWPPVGVVGAEWTEVAPVQVSRSMITGAERISAFQRKRRMVNLTVPGVGRTTYDAGYIEMLKRYLEGTHLVRLHSYPIAWHLGAPRTRVRRGDVFTDSGQTYVVVYGLDPEAEVCRPSDFITVFTDEFDTALFDPLDWLNVDDPLSWNTANGPLTWFYGAESSTGMVPGARTVQVTQPVRSDDGGRAVIPVFENVSDQTNIYLIFGASDTGAFRPMSYPRAMQPNAGNWTYDWQFREVFPDEVGGFVEVNPWAR